MHRDILCLVVAAMLGGALPAIAQDAGSADPRIDAESGRQAARWAPDRPFDHLNMKLEIDIPDLNKPTLTGVLTLRVTPIGQSRSVLPLNSKGPVVDEVTVGDQVCLFEQHDPDLLITLPHAYQPGEVAEVTIRYSLDFSKDHGEGLTWSRGRENGSSPTLKFVQLHAQGEAEFNSKWFPCHDFPNEKLTSELVVTIPDSEDENPYEVLSNGHLVSKTPIADHRTRWDWVQDKPHSPYLVTLAVGKFGVVDLGGPGSARPGLPINVYTPVGTEDNVKESFKNTPAMIAFFETRFDEPYPWDKYSQACVRDFSAGGMENTSATLLTVGTSRVKEATQDDLISHELAHQWFGDLVTCRKWDDLWLNEGWATYCEALWNEHKAGDPANGGTPEKAWQAYRRSIAGNFRGGRGRARAASPQYPAMVSNRYTNPDSVFTKPDNPYSKGAAILHMLRMRLSDEAFFKGVHNYLEKYKFGTATTDDFRFCLEAVSGQSLQRFFEQWCERPGMARLSVDYAWNVPSGRLDVTVEQTQAVDRLNPAYAFSLPIQFTFADGTTRTVYIDTDQTIAHASFDLPSCPTKGVIDPDLTVLASSNIRTELPESPDAKAGDKPDAKPDANADGQ